jgi:predicted dehydrogenase
MIEADNKQGVWRDDPGQSGEGGSIGDIGTHAENLLRYITGLSIEEVAADIKAFVEGRKLDDNANMLLRLSGGARGILHCSQICIGHENDLYIKVYGELGSLEWHQIEPNTLTVSWPDKPKETWRASAGYLDPVVAAVSRTPGGHPEGYLEGFANVYREFGNHILAVESGTAADKEWDYPGIVDAVEGMGFIRAVVTSSKANAAWTNIPALIAA